MYHVIIATTKLATPLSVHQYCFQSPFVSAISESFKMGTKIYYENVAEIPSFHQ